MVDYDIAMENEASFLELPDNFWDNINCDPRLLKEHKDSPDFRLEHFTQTSKFRILTIKDSRNYVKYHTTIYNEDLAASRRDTPAPLNIPGYVAKVRSTTIFEDALFGHYAALGKLKLLGF